MRLALFPVLVRMRVDHRDYREEKPTRSMDAINRAPRERHGQQIPRNPRDQEHFPAKWTPVRVAKMR